MPGLNGTGCARKALTQSGSGAERRLGLVPGGHAQEVADAHRLQVVARLGGRVVGEELSTSSSTLSFPSATARPTAVEVKLLLSE